MVSKLKNISFVLLTLLDAFCQFHLTVNARRVIVTHLHELGRDANDYWDDVHVQAIGSKLRAMSANLSVASLQMGNGVVL